MLRFVDFLCNVYAYDICHFAKTRASYASQFSFDELFYDEKFGFQIVNHFS